MADAFDCWVSEARPSGPHWWICRAGEDTVPEILPAPGVRPFSSFEALEIELAVLGWERASGWKEWPGKDDPPRSAFAEVRKLG